MLWIVVGAAAVYVGYSMYTKSLQPIATNIVRSSNAWTTTGNTLAVQNAIVSHVPSTDPLTQLPCHIVTYANGYQERLQTFNGATRTKGVY